MYTYKVLKPSKLVLDLDWWTLAVKDLGKLHTSYNIELFKLHNFQKFHSFSLSFLIDIIMQGI